MTRDQAVALSLLEDLPRLGLTQRLLCDDPELLERAARGLAEAQAVRERAAASGIHVAPWNAPEYPPSLLTLPDSPPAIWYVGSLTCIAAPSVAIVGSRVATAVALEAASRIAAGLAALGITVVSGLARGVDSAAHRGALRDGCTLAVLGSGPDRVYPAEHRSLAAEIAVRGAVISEYPPGTPPLPFHFPLRNRLISGLASAVVVIEAAEDSGSLITAACALDQGREVMAVPGNVLTGRNRGGHALIRDGATIVECATDVTAALGWPVGGWSQRTVRRADATTQFESNVSGDLVLSHMAPGEPCDLDALAAASSLGAAELIPRLVALEMSGLVRRLDGGRFVRC